MVHVKHLLVHTQRLIRIGEQKIMNFRYFASTLNGQNFISDKKKFILSNCMDQSYNLGKDVKRQLKLV